jgi:hypothetical protein
MRLSAGLTCAKHNWSFDLVHGKGDRGSYKLQIWEVQLRPVAENHNESGGGVGDGVENLEREVWVRKKQRIG